MITSTAQQSWKNPLRAYCGRREARIADESFAGSGERDQLRDDEGGEDGGHRPEHRGGLEDPEAARSVLVLRLDAVRDSADGHDHARDDRDHHDVPDADPGVEVGRDESGEHDVGVGEQEQREHEERQRDRDRPRDTREAESMPPADGPDGGDCVVTDVDAGTGGGSDATQPGRGGGREQAAGAAEEQRAGDQTEREREVRRGEPRAHADHQHRDRVRTPSRAAAAPAACSAGVTSSTTRSPPSATASTRFAGSPRTPMSAATPSATATSSAPGRSSRGVTTTGSAGGAISSMHGTVRTRRCGTPSSPVENRYGSSWRSRRAHWPRPDVRTAAGRLEASTRAGKSTDSA